VAVGGEKTIWDTLGHTAHFLVPFLEILDVQSRTDLGIIIWGIFLDFEEINKCNAGNR
jgi:hypothetical protein